MEKKKYVIKYPDETYLKKGYPKHYKNGTYCNSQTKHLEDARIFIDYTKAVVCRVGLRSMVFGYPKCYVDTLNNNNLSEKYQKLLHTIFQYFHQYSMSSGNIELCNENRIYIETLLSYNALSECFFINVSNHLGTNDYPYSSQNQEDLQRLCDILINRFGVIPE